MATTKSQAALRISIVDDSGTRANRMGSSAGACADAWSGEIAFAALMSEVDIQGFDEEIDIRFISENGTVNDSFRVRKNGFRSFVFEARGFEHRNHVAGVVGSYEVVRTRRVI